MTTNRFCDDCGRLITPGNDGTRVLVASGVSHTGTYCRTCADLLAFARQTEAILYRTPLRCHRPLAEELDLIDSERDARRAPAA